MRENLVLQVVQKTTFQRVVDVVENKSIHGIRLSCVQRMSGADRSRAACSSQGNKER